MSTTQLLGSFSLARPAAEEVQGDKRESETERHGMAFMNGTKVKASGCAVIVEDVLIKAFGDGF